MKLRTLFFRFLAIYLAGFLIMFMCSFLVAVSSFRIIRSDMLSRWNVTKERGIADIADRISGSYHSSAMVMTAAGLFYRFWRQGMSLLKLESLSMIFPTLLCFSETMTESLGIPVLAKKGRSRVYSKIGKRKKIWEAIKPFLRNPLIKAYYLQRDFLTKSID